MIDLMMIFHILVEGLLVLRDPKATLTLFVVVILNMDFYTSRVEAHNTLVLTCFETPSSSCYKTYPSQHSNGC
jgi:hypothetical protein